MSVVNNGTPGQQPDIRIRGTVSMGQVHPLYVVDGIFNDNIDYLNPNDIESIEILKRPFFTGNLWCERCYRGYCYYN